MPNTCWSPPCPSIKICLFLDIIVILYCMSTLQFLLTSVKSVKKQNCLLVKLNNQLLFMLCLCTCVNWQSNCYTSFTCPMKLQIILHKSCVILLHNYIQILLHYTWYRSLEKSASLVNLTTNSIPLAKYVYIWGDRKINTVH
jgi:hypothetical protein